MIDLDIDGVEMSAEVKKELGVEDDKPGVATVGLPILGHENTTATDRSKMNFGVMKLKRGKQSEIADRKNMSSVAQRLGKSSKVVLVIYLCFA